MEYYSTVNAEDHDRREPQANSSKDASASLLPLRDTVQVTLSRLRAGAGRIGGASETVVIESSNLNASPASQRGRNLATGLHT